MSEPTIFIDESGDFGSFEPHTPHYLLTLVFHDHTKGISERIEHLKRLSSRRASREKHAIHCTPLVQRENGYKDTDSAMAYHYALHTLYTHMGADRNAICVREF